MENNLQIIATFTKFLKNKTNLKLREDGKEGNPEIHLISSMVKYEKEISLEGITEAFFHFYKKKPTVLYIVIVSLGLGGVFLNISNRLIIHCVNLNLLFLGKDVDKLFQDIANLISTNTDTNHNVEMVFIFNNISWSNIVLIFRLKNIYISGGHSTKRHNLSKSQYQLVKFLFLLDGFHLDTKMFNNSMKDVLCQPFLDKEYYKLLSSQPLNRFRSRGRGASEEGGPQVYREDEELPFYLNGEESATTYVPSHRWSESAVAYGSNPGGARDAFYNENSFNKDPIINTLLKEDKELNFKLNIFLDLKNSLKDISIFEDNEEKMQEKIKDTLYKLETLKGKRLSGETILIKGRLKSKDKKKDQKKLSEERFNKKINNFEKNLIDYQNSISQIRLNKKKEENKLIILQKVYTEFTSNKVELKSTFEHPYHFELKRLSKTYSNSELFYLKDNDIMKIEEIIKKYKEDQAKRLKKKKENIKVFSEGRPPIY